jgi:hypothetical protein
VRKKRANDWLPPTDWTQREALREKGQFWTPPWVAEAMVAYVSAEAEAIFDPAVGAGAFFRAAKALAARGQARKLKLSGAEIDPKALRHAGDNELTSEDLRHVEICDFVLDPPRSSYEAIVANPPYVRHHRIKPETKRSLQHFVRSYTGLSLDARAGLHVYFLLRALQLLAQNGRLAFIMPADTCEGVFAESLWEWVTSKWRLEAVVTFSPGASPFPGVDTNPVIFFIRNVPPSQSLLWAECTAHDEADLTDWVLGGFQNRSSATISVHRRELSEALITGLSRRPVAQPMDGTPLLQFATVQRGIVTGANEFFFLTRARAAELQIPDEFLKQAIGRTRDLTGDVITEETFNELDQRGRPTLLLSLDDRPFDLFPSSVKSYIRQGEAQDLPKRVLLSTRNPWYKMEIRPVPPILFAYLGRRNVRFIRNLAGALPLTCFLCVFPRQSNEMFYVDRLCEVLASAETLSNLRLVGKSYGSGAIKVEPRALERVILPRKVINDCGLLTRPLSRQLSLLA